MRTCPEKQYCKKHFNTSDFGTVGAAIQHTMYNNNNTGLMALSLGLAR